MSRILPVLLFAVQFFTAPSVDPLSSQTDDLSAKLDREVSNYNLGLSNFPDALLRISNDFKIPMGIMWVSSPAARAQIPFAWTHTTVREIIQDVAKTQPNYQVRAANGVVHVFPPIPDRENFLKLKIDSFKTSNAAVELASFKLHTLVAPMKGSRQVSVAGPGDSLVNVDLKNCTVQDVLDALAVASNRKVWVVTFPEEPTMTPDGLRRTKSLFTEAPIRDEEQPIWYLYRWGDPTPSVSSSTGPHGR